MSCEYVITIHGGDSYVVPGRDLRDALEKSLTSTLAAIAINDIMGIGRWRNGVLSVYRRAIKPEQ